MIRSIFFHLFELFLSPNSGSWAAWRGSFLTHTSIIPPSTASLHFHPLSSSSSSSSSSFHGYTTTTLPPPCRLSSHVTTHHLSHKVSSIEILRNGIIQRLFFMKHPICEILTSEEKENAISDCFGAPPGDRHNIFQSYLRQYYESARHRYVARGRPFPILSSSDNIIISNELLTNQLVGDFTPYSRSTQPISKSKPLFFGILLSPFIFLFWLLRIIRQIHQIDIFRFSWFSLEKMHFLSNYSRIRQGALHHRSMFECEHTNFM